MVSTFLKTFRQINDPKIIKALVLATLLTFVSIIIAVMIGVGLVDRLFDFFSGFCQTSEANYYVFDGCTMTFLTASFFDFFSGFCQTSEANY